MISKELFFTLLYVWIALAVITFWFLLRIRVPYGRHSKSSWGPNINNRLGWFLMELPVLVVFTWLFFTGNAEKNIPVYVIYSLFMLHYINRVFIFPFRIRSKKGQMPVVIVLLAVFFNVCNGFFNGYWLGTISGVYYDSWLLDPRFIIGIILFFTGMIINIASDNKLINLRKGGKKGYFIPKGGLFNYISSPNLFGEIIEWLGWAIMGWSLAGFSFALWTMANLIPRSLDHHNWYKQKFPDYPSDRKAVIPKVL